MRSKLVVLIVLVAPFLLYDSNAYACDPSCRQNFVVGTRYPFTEMNQGGETTITGNADPALAQWVTVRDPCFNGELHGTEDFNALIRASYNLTGPTSAPAGSTFETRITVYQSLGSGSGAGTVLGQSFAYTRKIKASIDTNNRQGEWFNSVITNLPGNTDLDVRLEVRLLASATVTVDFAWINAQGSPTVYGAGTTMNGAQQVIGGSWVKLADATFSTAGAGENVDAILQSYMEFVSGNPGDQILIGLGVDDHSSNGHNSVVYVPASFPDASNGFDNVPNAGYQSTIPADGQTHHFQLWAKNMSGGATTVRNCQVQGVAFPVSNGAWAGQPAVGYADVPGPIAARSNWDAMAQPQPDACLLLDDPRAFTQITSCQDEGRTVLPTNGTWTKVATMNLGAHGSTTGYNWVGQGFIEFLGRTSTWNSSWCQIGIENIANENPIKAVENGMETFTVPVNNGQTYFFLDAHRWGTGFGNQINLWVRKVTATGDQGSYTIGRAYIGVRLVDAGAITCEQ